ncbi:unnamed protein product [Schistocephalus solidus]|uniref:Very-long-chain 3-oxoacyl-CoA synthase n=1 Tax=Schistocephalus solidus TaxID=70667 RepID=A0A183TI60_SCHSO|nr:unnamed protein product [Schistocephalus solidus]
MEVLKLLARLSASGVISRFLRRSCFFHNCARRSLQLRWVFRPHDLGPDGCLWPLCNPNSKWSEKVADDFHDVLQVRKSLPKFRAIWICSLFSFAYALVDKAVRLALRSQYLSTIFYFNKLVVHFTAMRLNAPV